MYWNAIASFSVAAVTLVLAGISARQSFLMTQTGYLKEWRPKREHQVLRSWNPGVPPILVQPDDEIAVQGVVVNVTFDPRRIRKERKGGRR
ncbi:hypothetical protein [Oceanithermus desulfurans]